MHSHQPIVTEFFHEPSFTYSYVVQDPATKHCAIIDSVLDFDYSSGTTSTHSADQILAFIGQKKLTVEWILETHVHADHLSAAPYIQNQLGGLLAIGEHIKTVQKTFGKIYRNRYVSSYRTT